MAELPTELTVDLADPSDVQKKLPEARRIAGAFREEAEQLIERADAWDRLVHVLEGIAPKGKPQTRTIKPALERDEAMPIRPGGSSVDAAVAIVDQTGGAITVGEVHKLAPQFSRKTIGWALWQAAKNNKILSLGKGVYAPRDYNVTELPLEA